MTAAEGHEIASARERVEAFTGRVQAIRECLHQVIVGQNDTIDLLMTCGLTGARAPGRRPRIGEDVDGQGPRLGVSLEVRPDSVHAGPDAFRHHRLRTARPRPTR